MQSALLHEAPDAPRRPIGRRAIAFGVVVLVHLLLALMLLFITPALRKMDMPKVFEMSSYNAPKPAAKQQQKRKAAAKPQPKPQTQSAKAPPMDTTKRPEGKLFDTQLFEAIDITKLPNHRAEQQANATATASADGGPSGGDSAIGAGQGPGGQTLYNAEWQREPTHAELAYYLPKGAPQGAWAVIACRTVANYRVEDCQELGDSPPGSRLAGAIRQAAWQFRVRPPRIDGKSQVGAWVRIRIDFSQDAG